MLVQIPPHSRKAAVSSLKAYVAKIHYCVTIPDLPDAHARRLEARPAHIQRASVLHKQGLVVLGAAHLTEDLAMTGSTFILDVPDRHAVDEFIQDDPYVKNSVWDLSRATVQRIQMARFSWS